MQSKYFTLVELCRSQTATRTGIDMRAPPEVEANLRHLASAILDPIRDAAGQAVFVSSGYRPARLNALVGGSPNSDHLYGRAADIVLAKGRAYDLMRIVWSIREVIPLHKAILEFGAWVHVSVAVNEKPQRQFFTASRDVANGTIYRPWMLEA